MKKLSTLIIALLTTLLVNAQQSTFSKVYYDVAGNEQAYDVVPTFDHSYLVVGSRDLNGLVMKIDLAGNLLWSKKIGDDNMTELSRIITTSDSNYVMMGQCKNSVLNDHDVFCVKINSAGDTLWSKSIDMGADDYAKSIQMTFDKGFIISGIRNQTTVTPYSLMFVIKLDAAGNLVWSKKISKGNWENEAFSVKQLPDSGYAVIGFTEDQVGSNFEGRACLIKLLPDGTFSWAKSISPSFNMGYDIEITPTGILCLTSFSGGLGVVFAKTDFSGNLKWSTRNNAFLDGAYLNQPAPKLSATSDGGFLYCSGGSFSPSNVIKIDTSAAPVWSKFVYQRSSIAIEIQDSGTLILGNGPVYGVKTYPTFNPQIGIITLDSATHSVAPCLYDNFTSVDGGSVGVTSITCSAATGGTMEARHPVVSIFTLDSYDGCVAFMGSVEENHAENYVTAYPNPNPGVFTLEMKTQMENYSATITDITGRTIYNKTVTHAAHQILDISDQPNGIYFLTVIYGTKQYRTKVVLVK